MSDNIVEFPTDKEITVNDVLDKAKEADLETVVLIGHDEEGMLFLGSDVNDAPKVLWMLEKTKKFILENF